MARWKVAEQPHVETATLAVPAELKNHQAACWLDAALFKRWCRKHLGREVTFLSLQDQSRDARYTRAVHAWSEVNDLVVEQGFTPWIRLGELGVRPIRRLRAVDAS